MKKILSMLRKAIVAHPFAFGFVAGAIGGFLDSTTDLFFDFGYSFNARFIRHVVREVLFLSITMGLIFHFALWLDRMVRGKRSSSNGDNGGVES